MRGFDQAIREMRSVIVRFYLLEYAAKELISRIAIKGIS